MSPEHRHLVLLAKAPRIGRVKTRLAAAIGRVQAWAFYRRCLNRAMRALPDPRWTSWLALTPDGAAAALPTEDWIVMPQGGGDLGERMLAPMHALPFGPVVLVGADIPQLSTAHIWAAFGALRENDIVFGPASDGGFWLVGMNRTRRIFDPFRGVRWSSRHALADTIANLPDGTRIGFVETLADVDEAPDLSQ